MKSKRGQRLDSEFRKNIYDVIKNQLNNPLITEMFSITEVDVSPDMKNAKVFVSVYSTDAVKKKNTFDAIVASAGEIRRCLSSIMHVRYVPVLRFYEDSALEYGNKIDMILSTITYGEDNDDNWDFKSNFKT